VRGSQPDSVLTEEVQAVLASAGWTATAPSGTGAVRERWESLQALAALADDLRAARPEATMADFVAELNERASTQHPPTVEGVTLASLHAAKGLEWDAVFLVGVSDGLLPISLAEGAEAIEEERRLLYVGVTRAREHLSLTWSRSRTPGGRASRSPSRFLNSLFAETTNAGRGRREGAGAGAERRDGRKKAAAVTCRTCATVLSTAIDRKIGRCGSCPATYDEGLFERLRAWRAEAAAEAKVPAYVVFTDATLVAIAETLPVDLMALTRIAGVGSTKLERYGSAVLAVLAG